MICHGPSVHGSCEVLVDGVSMRFSYAPHGIKVSAHTYILYSSLMRTAGGLWSLYGLGGLLLRRKPLR